MDDGSAGGPLAEGRLLLLVVVPEEEGGAAGLAFDGCDVLVGGYWLMVKAVLSLVSVDREPLV